MGSTQSSTRTPKNLGDGRSSPDRQAVAGQKAWALDNDMPQDLEYGNLGPNSSARVPDKYGENDEIVNGCNNGWQACSGAAPGDENVGGSKVAPTKNANPTPGGGW